MRGRQKNCGGILRRLEFFFLELLFIWDFFGLFFFEILSYWRFLWNLFAFWNLLEFIFIYYLEFC